MSEVATTGDNEFQLTEQDVAYVAAKAQGLSTTDAVLQAFADDDDIVEANGLVRSSQAWERQRGVAIIRRKAAMVSKRRSVKVLTEKYQERMQRLGDIALDTIEEIMVEGRSEKVRADVAIEVARHNLGTPKNSDDGGGQNVIIIIGNDPSTQIKTSTVIEGEVVDGEDN